jgi:hypothetical protein
VNADRVWDGANFTGAQQRTATQTKLKQQGQGSAEWTCLLPRDRWRRGCAAPRAHQENVERTGHQSGQSGQVAISPTDVTLVGTALVELGGAMRVLACVLAVVALAQAGGKKFKRGDTVRCSCAQPAPLGFSCGWCWCVFVSARLFFFLGSPHPRLAGMDANAPALTSVQPSYTAPPHL